MKMLLMLLIISVVLPLLLTSAVVHVHMAPHSHDDPGWLKTVDQYYSGANSTIYLASVKLIFDSVIKELQVDRRRKYSMCEISFLSRWWKEQTAVTKEIVRGLVKSGQLAVVNGGWVMHDEASSHFVSMIDQTTLGHAFLLKELGYTPKNGWQIDPFGHANTHAHFSSEFGFDGLYFGRIDYQDAQKRMAERSMEFVWRGSASQPSAQVFTGVFTSLNYGAPKDLCFDRSCVYCRDDPVESDTALETFNLPAKVQALVTAIDFEVQHGVGSNVMLKMGADFVYENAASWFGSMDLLIQAVNEQYPQYRLFYSTPDDYTRAKAAEQLSWSVKTDDFFPYADAASSYWSGYFTSRPTLKFLERASSGFLQALRQTGVLLGAGAGAGAAQRSAHDDAQLSLSAAVGLVNHHDAITGTSKQHVADDYTKILSKALSGAEQAFAQSVVGSAVGGGGDSSSSSSSAAGQFVVCRAAQNESSCPATQALAAGRIDVVAYNPLPRAATQPLRVLLSRRYASVQAVAADGSLSPVSASIFPTFATGSTSSSSTPPSFTLAFSAPSVPALRSRQFLVSVFPTAEAARAAGSAPLAVFAAPRAVPPGQPLSLASSHVSIGVDSQGLLATVVRSDPSGEHAPISANVSQNLAFYASFGSPGSPGYRPPRPDARDPSLKNIEPPAQPRAGQESTQASGAYLFRSLQKDAPPAPISTSASVELIESAEVTEVRQRLSEWATQVLRIRPGSPAVEIEWTVGPIPIQDGLGKEVVSTFASSLASGPVGANVFHTDANGREFQKRVKNYRPTWDLEVTEPIAGNFYPITAGIYLQDASTKTQLSVLSDRSQAAASLRPGQLELMVHRRLLADDERGVGEALNETTGGMSPYPTWTRSGDGITVSGRHWLLLSAPHKGMVDVRAMMDELYQPMQTLLQPRPSAPELPSTFSLGPGLGADLPRNVALVTLQRLPESSASAPTLLLRLAHQLASGESGEFSQPVSVDLAALLQPFKPLHKTLLELNLSGNQPRAQMDKDKVQWRTADGGVKAEHKGADRGMVITLHPMEIKTWVINLQE